MELKERAEKLVIEIKQLKKDYAVEDSEVDEGNLFDAVYRQNETIKDLLAENERLRNPLRPIEECPDELKDGRDVLGVDKNNNFHIIMRWFGCYDSCNDHEYSENWRCANSKNLISNTVYDVTHFMELPTVGG